MTTALARARPTIHLAPAVGPRSAGVQAADLLNWYRAFQPGVDDALAVNQYFTGAMTLRGWPLQLTDAAFSSEGGEAQIPGIALPVRIGAMAGGRRRDTLTIEPFRIAYAAGGARAEPASAAAASASASGKDCKEEQSSTKSGSVKHGLMRMP